MDLITLLKDLGDVDNNLSPTDKQILVYDSVTGQWKAQDGVTPLAGSSSERPSNPKTGEMFFDLNLNKPIWFNGSEWVDSSGYSV